MQGRHSFALALLFSMQVSLALSTSCDPNTETACVVSSHVTGYCQIPEVAGHDFQCECYEGYTPSDYGCSADLESPTIHQGPPSDDTSGTVTAEYRLRCVQSQGRLEGAYLWWKNGELMVNENNEYLASPKIHRGDRYQCSYTFDSMESARSLTHVVSEKEEQSESLPASRHLVIVGMPARISSATATLTLYCVSFVKDVRTIVRWYHNDTLISPHPSQSPRFDFKVIPGMEGRVTCSVEYPDRNRLTLTSLPQTIPMVADTQLAATLKSNQKTVLEKGHLSLTCEVEIKSDVYFYGDRLKANGGKIDFTWYINGEEVKRHKDHVIQMNNVVFLKPVTFMCEARVQDWRGTSNSLTFNATRPTKFHTSKAATVLYKEKPLDQIKIPNNKVITLDCDVDISPWVPTNRISYNWIINKEVVGRERQLTIEVTKSQNEIACVAGLHETAIHVKHWVNVSYDVVLFFSGCIVSLICWRLTYMTTKQEISQI